MIITYIQGNRDPSEANLSRVGNRLILQGVNSNIVHQLILSQEQWKHLADSSLERVNDAPELSVDDLKMRKAY